MSGTFQLAGTFVGSFFGPVGAAVGGAIGGLVDQELFGKAINGPRLTEFRATGSAVGKPMTRGYGSNRIGGELIWFGRVRERKETKTTGGIGGFGGQKTNTFEYYATFAVGLQEGPGVCLRNIRINGRIWWEDPGYASGNVNYLDQQARLLEFGPSALTAEELAEYNATALKVASSQGRNEFFTFYSGTSDQAVDPTIANYFGDYAPAYRDLAYVVFKELPVTEYGGALPLIEFETVSGPTQSAQTVDFWVSQDMNPWLEGTNDPRHPLNSHEYSYYYPTGSPIRDVGTFAEAIADAEAEEGYTLDPTVIGWTRIDKSFGTAPYDPVTPEDLIDLEMRFNGPEINDVTRFFTLEECETAEGSSYPVTVSFDMLFALGCVQETFYWVPAVLASSRVGGIVYMSTVTGGGSPGTGFVGLDNCIPGLGCPYGGGTLWTKPDSLIRVHRIAACPPSECDDKAPLPENPDYCVDEDGNIYPEVEYSPTSGNFVQLAIYTEDVDSVAQYPLGPVLNLDIAEDIALNTLEFWQPLYLAAVEDGLVEAGWTFDATGAGGEGTYPRAPDTVCAADIQTEPYCVAEPVAVADVIEAEASRCKPLVLADLDTSLVTDYIWGIKFESAPTGRDAIEQLRTFSFLDVVDGPQLKFVPRGLPAVATLTLDDLAAHEYGSQRPPALEVTRVDDIQLPREVRVSYIDIDADLQPGQQYDRRLITDAVNVQQIELGIAMDADDGKRIATVSLYDQWAARKAIEFKLGPRWLMLEPTDCIELPDLDGVTRIRIDRDDLALPGLRSMQGVRDEISLYGRTATGATPQIPDAEDNVPAVQGPTTAIVLDLPYMGIGDSDAGYWVAFYGTLDGWQSAEGYRSLDGGTTYDSVVGAGSAIAGTVVAPYDGLEITVEVYGGELLSATAAAVAAGTNRFAVGAPGRWVIGGFETATEDSEGNYVLSDLTMGLFNTEWAIDSSSSPSEFLGVAGDSFVMLETVSRVSEEDSIVGDTVLFRPITAGTIFDNGTDQSFIARGNSRGFVTGFGTTTPPTHSQGATYIVGAGATGEWTGFEDYIVHDAEDDWFFEFPEDARTVRTTDGNVYVYTAGSAGYWTLVPAAQDTAAAVEDLEEQVGAVETEVGEIEDRVTGIEAFAIEPVKVTWVNAGGGAIVAADANDIYTYIPHAGLIRQAVILTQGGTGSCSVDIWKDTYANFPPTDADSITAAAAPSITSDTKYSDSTLTGWTKTVAAGDVLAFHLDSSTTFEVIQVFLFIEPPA